MQSPWMRHRAAIDFIMFYRFTRAFEVACSIGYSPWKVQLLGCIVYELSSMHTRNAAEESVAEKAFEKLKQTDAQLEVRILLPRMEKIRDSVAKKQNEEKQ
jgi:hypothetical protein